MTTTTSAPTAKPKGKQGFASMDHEKQRLIASLGGKTAHRVGTAHEWTSEEASLAGKKAAISRRRGAQRRFMEER